MKTTAHDGGGRASGVTSGITSVMDRMTALDFGPDPRDGVRAFNGMYLETTRQVWLSIAGRGFADRAFMDDFDVQFADLYFDALTQREADPTAVPRSWAALFDARSRPAGSSAQALWEVSGTWAQRAFEVGLDNLVAASARLILTPH